MKNTFDNWYSKKMYATPELATETEWIEGLLDEVKTIAIVGISSKAVKDSHFVGRYMQRAGYRIVPVNPGSDEILGEKTWPTLKSIPFDVDIVDIFRAPDHVPEVVDEALELSAPVIWLQLGTGTHNELASRVKSHGKHLIQNRCIKVDHQFLIRPKKSNQTKP